MSFFKSKKATLPPLPPPPSSASATANVADEVKRKRRRLSQTILTSPQGVLGAATTERKTLLGGK